MSKTDHGIEIQLERMDHKKHKLMKLIRSLPDLSYDRQPDETTWSIGKVANHLYLSERLSLAYLKKKLSYPDTIPVFNAKSHGSLFLVKLTLWLPIRVKAPVKINMWDGQDILPPDQLELQWNEVREELASVITENQSRFSRHLVYNHPYAGRMTMKQMLIFMNHHLAHHLRQARRIIKKIT